MDSCYFEMNYAGYEVDDDRNVSFLFAEEKYSPNKKEVDEEISYLKEAIEWLEENKKHARES